MNMKTDRCAHLQRRMKGWLFVKDTDSKPHKQYTVQGLGYSSEETLAKIVSMRVGDSQHIYDYKLTRVD